MEIFVHQTDYDILFCYTFTKFWFNTFIYLKGTFIESVILFNLMLPAQVYCTIISFTRRIIVTTSILISINNVVFLTFKQCWWDLFSIFLNIRYTIHFCSFTCVVCFLNTPFSCDRSVWSFSFILAINMLLIWCHTW